MTNQPINDGGPAFPVPVAQPYGEGLCAIGGMSLRDYFAGQALASVMSSNLVIALVKHKAETVDIVTACYELADAMLTQRNNS